MFNTLIALTMGILSVLFPGELLAKKKAPKPTPEELQKEALEALQQTTSSIYSVLIKAPQLKQNAEDTFACSAKLIDVIANTEGKKKFLTLSDPAYINTAINASITNGNTEALEESLQELAFDVNNAIEHYKTLVKSTNAK